jgi:ubiquinone/menaquinone biosynthesis C-methylase UbiE
MIACISVGRAELGGNFMQQQAAAQSLATAVLLPFASVEQLPFPAQQTQVPRYLHAHYWWAYVHPNAVKVFERPWLVNLILWGNYNRLRDEVLEEMKAFCGGRTLQVACVYGDLTNRLSASIAGRGGSLDVVDVLAIQLQNLRRKLPSNAHTRLLAMDSADLQLPDASYDQALAFFLLHEQPSHYRERTLRELMRVVKPGGKIIVVDYALPRVWHPLRYIWRPLLAKLEPFALDLWRDEITRWLPRVAGSCLRKTTYFGGLYQKIVITRPAAGRPK